MNSCTKRPYPTKAAAIATAIVINRTGKTSRQLASVYYCPSCRAYNLTSHRTSTRSKFGTPVPVKPPRT